MAVLLRVHPVNFEIRTDFKNKYQAKAWCYLCR